MRILVTRTDKLGDFMLAWPALARLRSAFPHAQIGIAVSTAIAEVAQACPYADWVVALPKADSSSQVATRLRAQAYTHCVVLFNEPRISFAAWRARIPYRLGPASKLAQVFFNRRLVQRRSRSEKPEWQYNRDLIERFIADQGKATPRGILPQPLWPVNEIARKATGKALADVYPALESRRLVIVHPGSGGSARNLSITQYAQLINTLAAQSEIFVLVTAGPGEEAIARELANQVLRCPTGVHVSKEGLVAFAHLIGNADLFISGSTGPLHIAGALNVRTAAFYPGKRSSTALRWQTTNAAHRRLAFSPPADANEVDMQAIDMRAAALEIGQAYFGKGT